MSNEISAETIRTALRLTAGIRENYPGVTSFFPGENGEILCHMTKGRWCLDLVVESDGSITIVDDCKLAIGAGPDFMTAAYEYLKDAEFRRKGESDG